MAETSPAGREFEIDGETPAAVDEAAVDRMRAVVKLLDTGLRVPGTDFRIGLDPILGVLPVAGDLVAAGLAAYLVVESARLGVSVPTLLRMVGNLVVDFVGGSVPVVGVVFDAFWKANRRNLQLALADLGIDA